MTVYELVEKVNGEIVRGQARVRRGNEYIVLGTLVEGEMTFTEAGQRLNDAVAPAPAPAPAPVRKARRFTPPVAAPTVVDERE